MNSRLPYLLLCLTALLAGCGQSETDVTQNSAAETVELRLEEATSVNALTWQQVRPALLELSSSKTKRDYVQGLINETEASAPAIYLKAMLHLGNSVFLEADRLMTLIPVESIPATFIYAPYRLQERLEKYPNRYLEPMLQAVQDNSVSTLIKARVNARTGNLQAALESYLATDPRRWTVYDATNIRTLFNHDGLRPDASLLIRRAQSSGRTSTAVTDALAAISNAPVAPSKAVLASDYAADAIETMLAMRKAFVNQDFSTIVSAYEATDVRQVSDELNLMLVVASVAIDNDAEATRWAIELKRRFPDQETREWLANLLNS